MKNIHSQLLMRIEMTDRAMARGKKDARRNGQKIGEWD